ncbi:MAG TPA: GyrI-like domain-containing protein [Kofleriaceae bacterium]
MDATIETIPRMRVAAVRHIGPYNQIGEAYARLDRIAVPAGLFAIPGIKIVGLYYDSPEATPAAELRSDAGLALPDGVAIPAGLDEVVIPAGRYAKSVHRGPYTGLPDAWSQLMGVWVPQQGHRLGGGVSFELYRNTPMDTKPEDLITEIYVPLAE